MGKRETGSVLVVLVFGIFWVLSSGCENKEVRMLTKQYRDNNTDIPANHKRFVKPKRLFHERGEKRYPGYDSGLGKTVLLDLAPSNASIGLFPLTQNRGDECSTNVRLLQFSVPRVYKTRLNRYAQYVNGKTTDVFCGIYINSFDSISIQSMDLTINIYFREIWSDSRLQYDRVAQGTDKLRLDRRYHDSIWIPDLFFPNEKGSSRHSVTTPNKLLVIFPNGTIFYSARYTIQLSCPMNLWKFPLDNQICSMKIESFSYTSDEIRLAWFGENAVELAPGIQLPQFQWEKHELVNCTASYVSGQFTCLEVKFYLKRKFGFYLVQTYVPSTLIVTLSWVSFWISHDAIPARISLGVLTVLSMTTQSIGLMAMPKVSYITAIDLWIAVCVCFVFSSTLEFALVNTLSRRDVRLSFRRGPLAEQLSQDIPPKDAHKMTMVANGRPAPPCRSLSFRRHHFRAKRVDKVARIGFPAAFIIFNLIYWIYYTRDP